MNAIQTVQLTKTYGKQRGVTDLNLSVGDGEVFGFIGPNGAGKSTTIRMIMQLSKPTSGSIELFGTTALSDNPDIRRQIGYLPSEVSYYPDMTGKAVLELTASAYGLRLKDTPASEYADLLQFDMSKRVKSYSLGNRKKLGIIQSLLHSPKLLILDEPTSGLDPLVQHAFFDLLQRLNSKGMTLFFSTHILSEVERLCHRVAFIKEGRLLRVSAVGDIEGRGQRIIAVQFKEQGNRIDAYDLRSIDPNVAYSEGLHHLQARGELNEALIKLARYPIADLTVRPPTLEELFMQDYEQGGTRR